MTFNLFYARTWRVRKMEEEKKVLNRMLFKLVVHNRRRLPVLPPQSQLLEGFLALKMSCRMTSPARCSR